MPLRCSYIIIIRVLTAPLLIMIAASAVCYWCSAILKRGGIKDKRVNKVNRSKANQLLMTEWPGPGMSHDPQMVRLLPWPSQTHRADKHRWKDKHRSQHPSSAGQKTLFNYNLLHRWSVSEFLCLVPRLKCLTWGWLSALPWTSDTWDRPINAERLVNLSGCSEWRAPPTGSSERSNHRSVMSGC